MGVLCGRPHHQCMNWVNAICSVIYRLFTVWQNVRRAWLEFLLGYSNYIFCNFRIISSFLLRRNNFAQTIQHHQIFALSQTKRKSLKYRDSSFLKSLQKFSDSGTNLLMRKNCKPKHVSLSSWPTKSRQ